MLHTTVVATAQQHTVAAEQRATHRDTALGQAGLRFGERNVHHLRRRHAHEATADEDTSVRILERANSR